MIKGVMEMVWNLSLITTMIHVCASFHSAVLCGIAKPQAKYPLYSNVK